LTIQALTGSLPIPRAADVFQVNATPRTDRSDLRDLSLPELADWQSRSRVFESVAVSLVLDSSLGRAPARPAKVAAVSADFFAVLRARPRLGRWFDREDARTPVAVIAFDVWHDELAGTPRALGSTVLIDSRPYTIVGVAPRELRLPAPEVEAWVPLENEQSVAPPQWTMRGFRAFTMIARARAGTSLAAVQADVAAIAGHHARTFPRFDGDMTAVAVPLNDRLAAPIRPVAKIFSAAAGLLLLIAAINILQLSLVAAVAHRNELAVRMALGGSRMDVLRSVLADASRLGLLGLAAGLSLGCALRQCVALLRDGQPALARASWLGDLLAPMMAAAILVVLFSLVQVISVGSRARNRELLC
jgi:hypothetical protein